MGAGRGVELLIRYCAMPARPSAGRRRRGCRRWPLPSGGVWIYRRRWRLLRIGSSSMPRCLGVGHVIGGRWRSRMEIAGRGRRIGRRVTGLWLAAVVRGRPPEVIVDLIPFVAHVFYRNQSL